MITLYANGQRSRSMAQSWGDQLKLTGHSFGKASPKPPKVSRPTRGNELFAGRTVIHINRLEIFVHWG